MLTETNLTALIPNTPTRPKAQSYLDFFITNNPKLVQPPITLHINPYPTETLSDHYMVASKLKFTSRTTYQEPKVKYDFAKIDTDNYEKLFWTLPWGKILQHYDSPQLLGQFFSSYFKLLCL